MKIRKRMDNEESRKFWESFPIPRPGDENIVLPSLGENWWEGERELSIGLLDIIDKE